MMARDANESIGPALVGDRAGQLQLRRIAGGKQAQGLVLRSEFAPQLDERFEIDRRRAAKRIDRNQLFGKHAYELHEAMTDDPVVGQKLEERQRRYQHAATANQRM